MNFESLLFVNENDLNILESYDFDTVLPELTALKGVDDTYPIKHKDNYYHTLKVVKNAYKYSSDISFRLASYLHDIGKAYTKTYDIDRGWCFHNHEINGADKVESIIERLGLKSLINYELVYKIVAYHGVPKELVKENVSDSAIRRFYNLIGADYIDKIILFCICDLTTGNQEKLQRYTKEYLSLLDRIHKLQDEDIKNKWRCPIDGNIIKKTFPNITGKEIGSIKNYIETAIKNGVVDDNYEEAYQFMVKVYGKKYE
jgi:putative nucleotidyltransferase with HDIG domain